MGDSLAQEAAPYLGDLLADSEIVPRFFAGTAPCDWVDQDLQADGARAVVISFSGNALTRCMLGLDGSALSGIDLVDRYRADVTALVEVAQVAGVPAVLVGQPASGGSPEAAQTVDALNQTYREVATELGAVFVDAGAAVEGPDGRFAHDLPCGSEDPECPTGGRVVVRSDDGGHFCPGAATPGTCQGYSPGAARFAAAIAAAL